MQHCHLMSLRISTGWVLVKLFFVTYEATEEIQKERISFWKDI